MEIANYTPKKDDGIKIFSRLQTDKLDSLHEAITDIKALMDLRMSLSYEIFEDIDRVKLDVENLMMKAVNDADLKEQVKLKEKHSDFEAIKIQEKVNAWRDIAALKKELRERVKEESERESRKDILDSILE